MTLQLPNYPVNMIEYGAPASTATLNAPLVEIEANLAYLKEELEKLSPIEFSHLASQLIASQAQAEEGTATDVLMTPERVAQAIGINECSCLEDFSKGYPKAVYLQEQKCWDLTSILYIDIKEGSNAAISVSIPATKFLRSDLGNNDTTYDLSKVITNALNASSVENVYLCEYHASGAEFKLKITRATGSLDFVLQNNTGTNAANNVLKQIGWADSDTASGTSSIADDRVLYSAGMVNVLFWAKCDASVLGKQGLTGFIDGNFTKFSTPYVRRGVIGFSGLTAGKDYYTTTDGDLVLATNKIAGSQKAGTALTTSRLLLTAEERTNMVNNAPFNFQSSSVEYQNPNAREVINGDIHINANGQGAWVYVDQPVGDDMNYRIRYTTDGGVTWTDSASSFDAGSTSGAYPGENYGGGYYLRPRVFVDENGAAVLVYLKRPGSYWLPYAAYTSTASGVAGTWSDIVGYSSGVGNLISTGELNFYIGDLYIREGKAAVMFHYSSNTDTRMSICDYSSGDNGYKTWSNTLFDLSNDLKYDIPSWLFIQYDASIYPGDPLHKDNYRIVVIGQEITSNYMQYETRDGEGGALNNANIKNVANWITTATMDQSGDGNNIIISYSPQTSFVVKWTQFTQSDLSTNPITWSDQYDIGLVANGGTGKSMSTTNGFTTSGEIHLRWNQTSRAILRGNSCYILYELTDLDGSARGVALMYTNDLTGNNWETFLPVGNGDVNKNEQEPCMVYIPSIDSIVVAFREMNTLAESEQLSTGYENKVWTRLLELNGGSGIPSMHDLDQVNGSTFTELVAFTTITGSSDGAVVCWEQKGDSYAYDDLHHNYLG